MPETQTESVILQREWCCNCGVVFAIPQDLIAARKRDLKNFYCPNGHPMVYRESEADRLKRELIQKTARLDQALADANHQRERVEAERRRTIAARGRITRLKNRIGAGVCPCCNRFFCELASHVRTEHPNFKKEDHAE